MEPSAELVARLIARQFPQWSERRIAPVSPGGWDHRTFRLGDDLLVRLPSEARYVPQVEKEHRWLPVLAPRLPLPIPRPVARGEPSDGYPWPWSVYRWIEGEPATHASIADADLFAQDLAEFLRALQRIDPTSGPEPGEHNFFRGGPVATYDQEVRDAIGGLAQRVDAPRATAVWEAALESKWEGPNVWVHGDVAASNLLSSNGRLAAVIDFGSCGVGDPACDLTIAWTFFSGPRRDTFRTAMSLDSGTWTRARGWALWKALIQVAGPESPPGTVDDARRVLAELLG
jgi:aminoglycoside phosphotransferase (APT) family kinase protein